MKLYALCDQEMLDKKGISLEKFISKAQEHSAEIIQYRNKTADISFTKNQLIKIRNLYNGTLIVNDKYELIEYCDGVHLGQEDLKLIDHDIVKAISSVRNVIKDKILGISTHNTEEILIANTLDLNYIGLGAYRATSTKTDVTTIIGKKIEEIASQSKHQVAVIGGVTLQDNFKHITYSVIGSGLVTNL